MILCVIAS